MKQFDFYHTKCRISGPVADALITKPIIDATYRRIATPTTRPVTVVQGKKPTVVGSASAIVTELRLRGVSLETALTCVFALRPDSEVVTFEGQSFKANEVEAVNDGLVYIGYNAKACTLYYAFSSYRENSNPLSWPALMVTTETVLLNAIAMTARLQFTDLAALSWHATAKFKALKAGKLA